MSGMSFSSGGGRYGGFGNDSMAYSGGGGSSYGNDYGSYSGGGGGSSARGGSFSDRRQVEEYDAGDDETITRAPGRSNSLRTASLSGSRATPVRQSTMPTPAPAAPAAPIPNLLDLDDDVFGAPAPAPAAPSVAVNKALPKPSVGLDDDDFDDFQAAPVQAPAAPVAPVQAALTGGSAPLAAAAAPANRNLMDLLNASGPVQSQRPQQPPMGTGMGSFSMGGGMHRPTSSFSQPSQFSSPIQPQPGNAMFGGAASLRPTATSNSSFSSFDDLWSMSLGGSSSKPATPVAGGNKSIQDLQKEKANANLWGGLQQQQRPGSNANAFGAFGAGPAASSNSSGGDDLLL
ncbi:hypothetical protein BDQ17DRAFT_354898 [Cyathus striatus]|nr:hypothetical protein BDQ17DRAFT_354898 [Cyathus striatus]